MDCTDPWIWMFVCLFFTVLLTTRMFQKPWDKGLSEIPNEWQIDLWHYSCPNWYNLLCKYLFKISGIGRYLDILESKYITSVLLINNCRRVHHLFGSAGISCDCFIYSMTNKVVYTRMWSSWVTRMLQLVYNDWKF